MLAFLNHFQTDFLVIEDSNHICCFWIFYKLRIIFWSFSSMVINCVLDDPWRMSWMVLDLRTTAQPCQLTQNLPTLSSLPKKSVNFFLFSHFICKRSPIPTASRDYFGKPDPIFFHFLSLILLWQSQSFLKKIFWWNTSEQAGLARWYFSAIVWNWRSLDVCFVHLGSSEIFLQFF